MPTNGNNKIDSVFTRGGVAYGAYMELGDRTHSSKLGSWNVFLFDYTCTLIE